jgi:hypothetical protein
MSKLEGRVGIVTGAGQGMGAGRYDMEFVRVAGEWKISVFGFLWNFNTPYDEGWVKTPLAIL